MGGRRADNGERLSSQEADETLRGYRRAALWGSKVRIAAVEKLVELVKPSRPTTKVDVLADRADILIEFQRLEEAIVEDLPEELEGLTKDLIEIDLLTTSKRVVRGEWMLGAQGTGAKGGGSGMPVTPPKSLREISRQSIGRRLGWTWSECEKVIVEIRVAAAQQAADLAQVRHIFGRHPAGREEPWAFDLVDGKFPRCRQDQCGLEELPEEEHSEPARSAAQCRKRRKVKEPRESDGEDSGDEGAKRAAAKARFAGLRTATDEELRRALDGTLSVKDITRPSEELLEELAAAVECYQDRHCAENTRRSYDTGVKAFLTFCVWFACLGCLEPLLPATDATLARFITFSAWFVQPGTIKSYLAGDVGPAKPMMPITLRDLRNMARVASMETVTDMAIWAAILVGFYGLFRKDNLTVGKAHAWNTRGALVREDVLFTEAGDVVWLRVEGRGKRGGLVPMTHAVLVAGLKGLAEQVLHQAAGD
ncbi:hypothetical protein CYMTET_29208 [Cymbomonas tetramitiformis]|uniref:Core-binding (CB) domain-containing protein n=1 Tax=Cymbomonas tetramitiformis TaxID=36881 RepID=A0AAE0FLI4_9CHLO|nr:hypothetical protein CYMTET_29208 [Cymbomonas tetramitiformis]